MTQEPSSDVVPSLPPPAEPPPSPPRARRRRPLLWVLAVLVVIAAAAGSSPYWLPLLPSGSDDRLASDEARLAQLERQESQPPAEPSSLATLRARVAALEARSAAAPDTSAQQAASDAIQKLSARIDALESKAAASSPQVDPQDAEKLAAVADLRAALGGSGPYADEVDALRALGVDPTALKPLEASAKTGIPDRALLAEKFRAETAPAIVVASAAAPAAEPEDFSDRVLARLEGLVTIHRIDGSGSPSTTALRETEAALDKGDLDAADAALKPLSGKEAEAAQQFVAEVEARLAAEHAASELAREIEAKLAGGGHP